MTTATRIAELTAACRDQWAHLAARGWSLGPGAPYPCTGSACADFRHRRVFVRDDAWAQRGTRVRLYVIPHELGHALDDEAGSPSAALTGEFPIGFAAAREVVADACALERSATPAMCAWVRAAIVWHTRVLKRRVPYTWEQVRSAQARAIAARLWRVAG